MKGRIGLVVLVVAIAAAIGAALYLQRAQKKVEVAITPVVVAAPDLFPPDTLLFAAAHRMDESWNAAESWWKSFEPTATCYLVEKQWREARARKSLPPAIEKSLADFEKAMDEAEARLGSRPTTRQFFETYGKYTAFALLPGKGDGKPRMLLVVKLPGEAAMASLRERLGGVSQVKRHAPPELHGYPAWVEEGGPAGRILYGVGGGYLFVSDDADALGESLGRLALLAGTEKPAAGAAPATGLSADPVFQRAVPADWEQVGVALYFRREQQFARWDGKLDLLDQFVRHTFVLAPNDPAVALAAIRQEGGADFTVRASYAPGAGAAKPWEEFLPSGTCSAWMSEPTRQGPPRDALLRGLGAFRAKQAWKEIDALLRDGPRLRRLLEEALGPEGVPEEEVLRRLPRDAEFLAGNFTRFAEASLLAPTASFAFAHKAYAEPSPGLETVMATTVDPLTTLLVAGLFDLLVEKGGTFKEGITNPFEAAPAPGVQAWRFRVARLFSEAMTEVPPRERDAVAGVYAGMEPGLVVAGGRAWITFGDRLFAETRDLAAGKGATLAADPLFREVAAAVPPGAVTRSFSRPAEVLGGYVDSYRGMSDRILRTMEASRDGAEVLGALLDALDEVVLWQRSVRASMTATYQDPARPSETATLLDAAEEKAHPRLELDAAALAAPEVLPEGTFYLSEGRLDARPAADAFTAAFLRSLPGGRDRWDGLRAKLEIPPEELEARLEALLVDMKGEVGFAMAAPPVGDVEKVAGSQDLVDRIPALVFFAGYANPGAAFETAALLFEELAKATGDATPFEKRKRLFDRGQGPRPFGTAAVRTEMGGNPLAAFRLFWPEQPRGEVISAGIAVVRRGDILHFTTSLPVAAAIANAEPGGAGTLGARMRTALPAGTLPAACSRLTVLNEDGFADCLGLYTRPLAPGLAGLSLRGVRERPAPERIQAHQEGWSKVAHLLDDLLRTGHWSVAATTREGNTQRTVERRVPAK